MTTQTSHLAPVHVIGGGLAGSEAAWQIAQAGVPVILHEMRRDGPSKVRTDAHHTDGLAEMVCSNSFRSDDWEFNAVGLLHEEMRRLDSLIMRSADTHQVPAGGALPGGPGGAPCGQRAPNRSALRTSFQVAGGCGAFQRSGPTGAAA